MFLILIRNQSTWFHRFHCEMELFDPFTFKSNRCPSSVHTLPQLTSIQLLSSTNSRRPTLVPWQIHFVEFLHATLITCAICSSVVNDFNIVNHCGCPHLASFFHASLDFPAQQEQRLLIVAFSTKFHVLCGVLQTRIYNRPSDTPSSILLPLPISSTTILTISLIYLTFLHFIFHVFSSSVKTPPPPLLLSRGST